MLCVCVLALVYCVNFISLKQGYQVHRALKLAISVLLTKMWWIKIRLIFPFQSGVERRPNPPLGCWAAASCSGPFRTEGIRSLSHCSAAKMKRTDSESQEAKQMLRLFGLSCMSNDSLLNTTRGKQLNISSKQLLFWLLPDANGGHMGVFLHSQT